jgi:hypothetical protein
VTAHSALVIGLLAALLAGLAFLSATRAAAAGRRAEETRRRNRRRVADAELALQEQAVQDAQLALCRRNNIEREARLRALAHRSAALEQELRRAGLFDGGSRE